MSLSAAMLTGFTGIDSNSTAVDTVGNNLANLNTTAFKSQRTLFETLLYQTISEGEAPSGPAAGGTLPRQIGFGSTVASLQRNFGQGQTEGTGLASDLAIQGDGFFILAGPSGDQLYTRDGSFQLDASQTLVSANGAPVQVFPADETGAVTTGSLSNIIIPLGSMGPAVPTTQAELDGQLDSTTAIASAGAVVTSQPLVTAGGAAATTSTALTDLVNADGIPLFSTGDVLRINGSKGGIALESSDFIVGTTGSTLGDLAGQIETAAGISADPALAGTPGVTVSDGTEFPAGALVIRSNHGEVNAVELDAGTITNTTGAITSPLDFTTTSAATGAGVTTSFAVFDSLGNQVDVRLRLSLESKGETGATWRFFAESVDDSDLSPLLGTGTITFDANGQFVGATGTDLSIDRAGVGSASPLGFTLDFTNLTGLSTPDGQSEVVLSSQDGAPAGILTNYAIDRDGLVTGTYSNQQTEVFGQIALAKFPNNDGLIALADNTFAIGPNSGAANIVAPETAGAGFIRPGELEQSNVEIAREFINLISASTGISSAGRVVRVADQLLQELLQIVR